MKIWAEDVLTSAVGGGEWSERRGEEENLALSGVQTPIPWPSSP
jgi:hypothetical protein